MMRRLDDRSKATIAVIMITLIILLIIAIVIVAFSSTAGVIPPTNQAPRPSLRQSGSDAQATSSKLEDSPSSHSTRRAFNIDIRYLTPVSGDIAHIFDVAKARWESVIVDDVDGVVEIPSGTRLCGMVISNRERVNDLLLFVNVTEIDGVGNILANAGPCGVDKLGRVRAGLMNFDLADLNRLKDDGRAETVVLHEMGHEGNIGNQEIGLTGPAIIEETGGAGTAKTHWKESVYGSELMTGFIMQTARSQGAPLSALTVRSLADLGYTVDVTKADPFRVIPPSTQVDSSLDSNNLQVTEAPSVSSSSIASATSTGDHYVQEYGDDVLRMPMFVLPSHPKV